MVEVGFYVNKSEGASLGNSQQFILKNGRYRIASA